MKEKINHFKLSDHRISSILITCFFVCSRYDSNHIYSMIVDYESITIHITDLMLKSWCTFIVRTWLEPRMMTAYF